MRQHNHLFALLCHEHILSPELIFYVYKPKISPFRWGHPFQPFSDPRLDRLLGSLLSSS